MNKDAILATLIGFAIGLTITGIIIVAPTAAKTLPKFTMPRISLPSGIRLPSFGTAKKTEKTTEVGSGTKTTVSTNVTFDISSPSEDAIIATNTVVVRGSTHTKVVLVTSPVEDVVATVTNNSYSATISLKEGRNELTVTSVSENGSIETKSITN